MAPPRLRLLRGLLLFWFFLALGFAVETVRAQNTNATTDPAEARALNTVFAQWGLSRRDEWNISGELCTGVAIDTTSITNINPGIKCNCRFNNGTICRITALRVNQLDVFGPIPDGLWNLTMLEDLNLEKNYLTGPLSPSIGNLTRMQNLEIAMNALSGAVPGELGMLTDLIKLRFGTNGFSGPLPSELGSLSKLREIYFDSAGVIGPIPQTFARLQSLQIVWASDNALTGPIPDFIGNWSSLRQLRFQGNSFQGAIPQSFSSLISLNDLRISDLSDGSSSLDFLRNLNLSSLVLRNNNISGPIPSFFGAFQRMTLLDLSFNNLTGTIPDALFNLSSLTNLYLGNNKLTGTLPSLKNSGLRNIDLSYNELSGSFPSWVREQNLQINLVSNNFTLDNSTNSALPSGLNCLQRNFPCVGGSPRNSRFAIKCGGPQIIASSVVYERDNETLGPATYYMIDSGRWAVSNVGLPSDTDSTNLSFTTSTLSQITNGLDSELFQTARISAGSLRYYGLGMENGNYTLKLQFTESVIVETGTWRSLGKRVFHIYVQGDLVEQDFDIRKEAGGASLVSVVKEYPVEVSKNHIDIHLFWAGKGTCCVPAAGSYGPLISAISATPILDPTVANQPPGRRSTNRTGLIVGVVVGVSVAMLLCLIVLLRKKNQKGFEDEELSLIGARPYTFSYAELRAATNNFDPSNKLGEGGFGPVYKGTLGDGRAVAVKQLSKASHQGKRQFIAEIDTIYAVQHRNLVKLFGCCIEGDKRMLVYEYLENKSLDQILFGPGSKTSVLDWPVRFEICMGVARGLAYLHEESRLRIVHRDVKASNILLDSNLTPKISDFGLAKLYDDKLTHMSTRVAGTIGYLAPEYAMRGHLTEKADIFSFGVVALEIISGRQNSPSSLQDDMIYLLEWAWNLHESKQDIELVDPTLDEYNSEEVIRIISTALLCTQASPALRPSMSRVVGMLSGDIEVASVTTRPGYLTDWRFNDRSSFMSSNTDNSTLYGETSYLNTTKNTTMTTEHSPTNHTMPMLNEIIGEGR